MFKDPYQTTACRAYDSESFRFKIEKAIAHGEIEHVGILNDIGVENKVGKMSDVFVITDKCETVPPIAHPFVFESVNSEDEGQIIVVDLRAFVKTGRSGDLKVTSTVDLNFTLLRSGLTNYFATENTRDLASVGSFPVSIYCRWVAEAVSRRLAVDGETQMKMTILAGVFYLCQFRDKEDIDDNELTKIAGQVARATRISAEICIMTAERAGPMTTIAEFIEALQGLDSVRLEKLNPGLLVGVCCTGWFGANAQEIMAVALEHPPTFLALVYAGINHRGYQRSMFAKLVQQMDRRGAGKDFTYNLDRLPTD